MSSGSLDDFDAAHAEAAEDIARVIATEGPDASVILDHLVYGRPDLVQRLAYPPAKRAWWYWRRDLHWQDTPRLMRAEDEFGNDTIAVRLVFGQLVIATTLPLRRIVQPAWAPLDREEPTK